MAPLMHPLADAGRDSAVSARSAAAKMAEALIDLLYGP
jgi:hypothetical protein